VEFSTSNQQGNGCVCSLKMIQTLFEKNELKTEKSLRVAFQYLRSARSQIDITTYKSHKTTFQLSHPIFSKKSKVSAQTSMTLLCRGGMKWNLLLSHTFSFF
jgi:hypothetical protein